VEALTLRSQAAREAYEHQIAGVSHGNSGILLSTVPTTQCTSRTI